MLNVGERLLKIVTGQYMYMTENVNNCRPTVPHHMFDSMFENEDLFRYPCDFCSGYSTPMWLGNSGNTGGKSATGTSIQS